MSLKAEVVCPPQTAETNLEVIVYIKSGKDLVPDAVYTKTTLKPGEGFGGYVQDTNVFGGGTYWLIREVPGGDGQSS